MFPYGAQYYRTPNPPQSEWEKDFKTMADHGFTIAKIWAMWSWINYKEGKYDFSHFDRLFEIAEKNGIKLVINTILENAPYWLTKRHPEAFYTASDGQRFEPISRPNTPGGGWPGLCLDNDPVREQAAAFLKAVASRYADNSTLWGYDVWNEVFFEPWGYQGFEGKHFCYCPGTRARFVEWLKNRYGTLDVLNEAWYRRYTDWDQVYQPRYLGGYPDWLDWLRYRLDNQRALMRWRIETLRSGDPNHPLGSHGVAWTLNAMPNFLTNDFDIAQEVDQWGLSAFPLWANQHCSDYFRMLDLVRSASARHGKRFWQSELQGGQSGNGLARSRTPRARDTAFWNWMSFMVGAKGLMYWQWRPELLGPESPGFGLCRLDGTPSDRTEAAGWFARFMNDHPELSEAEPLKGEVAILVIPESQLWTYAAEGKTSPYYESVFGIYRALWNANVQVDFCTLDGMGQYPLVFLPFPLMLEASHAEALKQYVAEGGVLVSDAAPGHFIDHGYTSFKVPGLGLDELFGAVEDEMEYVASIASDGTGAPEVIWSGGSLPCSIYQEKLKPTSGKAVAQFTDGTVAVVDNEYGRGKARLIGTFPGISFLQSTNAVAESLIRDSLTYSSVQPRIAPMHDAIKARLHKGPSGDFLWVVNTFTKEVVTDITLLPILGEYHTAEDLASESKVEFNDHVLTLSLGPLQGAVLKLS